MWYKGQLYKAARSQLEYKTKENVIAIFGTAPSWKNISKFNTHVGDVAYR